MNLSNFNYNPPMWLDKKDELHTVVIKKEPLVKLKKISDELTQILEEEPQNNEALIYWRYIDSEIQRRNWNL